MLVPPTMITAPGGGARRSSVIGNSPARLLRRHRHASRRMAMILEPRLAPRLRLIAVDRHIIIIAPARMRHMIDAAAQRPPVPRIEHVEGQRRIGRQPRVQAIGRRPRLVAHAADRLARHRRSASSARAGRCRRRHGGPATRPRRAHLQPLGRAVDIAHRAADRAGLAQHVPGLERMADFELDAAGRRSCHGPGSGTGAAPRTSRDRNHSRRARRSPSTSRKSAQTKCGSMNRSCSARAPADQRALLRLAPEPGGERAQQQVAGRGSSARRAASRNRGTRPGRAARSGPSGENSLSMQISVRWVLPVTSTSRLRNSRSTSQGGGVLAVARAAGTCASAISSS